MNSKGGEEHKDVGKRTTGWKEAGNLGNESTWSTVVLFEGEKGAKKPKNKGDL